MLCSACRNMKQFQPIHVQHLVPIANRQHDGKHHVCVVKFQLLSIQHVLDQLPVVLSPKQHQSKPHLADLKVHVQFQFYFHRHSVLTKKNIWINKKLVVRIKSVIIYSIIDRGTGFSIIHIYLESIFESKCEFNFFHYFFYWILTFIGCMSNAKSCL